MPRSLLPAPAPPPHPPVSEDTRQAAPPCPRPLLREVLHSWWPALGVSSQPPHPGLTEKLSTRVADGHVLLPEGVHQRRARALDCRGQRRQWTGP